MANKIIKNIQTQLNQLATTCPGLDIENNDTWAKIVQELKHLSQNASRQECLLETATAISNSVNSSIGVNDLLDVSIELIKDSLDFYYVGVFLLNEANNQVELRADNSPTENSKLPEMCRVKIDDSSTTGWVINHQHICITDVGPNTAHFKCKDLPDARSEAMIPLITKGQIIGTLVIQSTQAGTFTDGDIYPLQTIGDQLANAIQNAEQFAYADRQMEQLVALHNISLHLDTHLDVETLLDDVAKLTAQLLNTDASIVRLVDEQQQVFAIKAVYNPPKGIELGQTEAIDETKNLSSRVIQTRQAILANDWSAVARDYAKSSIDTLAILNVPMAVQDKVIGTIEIHSFTKTHAFDENDRYSLSLLASQAATAIERTQLLNQLENNRHFLKTIIDHIPDPIFIKDRKHTWLEMNQANTHVLGQPAHELVGKSDKHFFSNELSDEFYRRDNEVFTKNQILEHEDKTVWGDGQEHIAYTRLIPISGTSGEPEYLLGITHDITERKAHEAEREQFLAETSALYEGSQSISSALSERQVFDALFEQIRLETPCEIAAFRFHMVKGEPIWAELKAGWQKLNNPTYPEGTRFYLPETSFAKLLTANEPLFLEEVATNSRLSDAEREGLAPTAAVSMAVLPLAFIGQELGSVLIYFTQPRTFSETTRRFWLAMIDQARVALSNRQFIQEAAYRAVQIDTAAEVARAASSLLDLNDLLNAAVALIRDRFHLYYVGIFLVDEANEWAVLRAGTGEAGHIQIANNHRLKIGGGESMIGWSIDQQQPRIALDVGKEAVHFQNPHLPDTRSEMALPLIYRNKAIGALTVQSLEQAAFSREDIIFLQTMADQLANAIENALLYEQAQQEITERKRTDKELRKSEGNYRELVESANSIIIRIDTQGRITFFNEFAQHFFGYSEQEILGQHTVGTIVPKMDTTGHDLATMIESILHHPEQYASNENENIRRDGERVWVSWANKAILDDDGQISEILCIGNDSTTRRQAEQALRESEVKYRTILESIEDGYYEVDLEGTLTFCNDALPKMFGYPADELLGMNNQQYTDEVNAKILFQTFNEVYKTGASIRGADWEVIRKDGQKRHIETSASLIRNANGEPVGFRGVARDVTERKQVEETLRRDEERFRSVVGTANDAIICINHHGHIIFWNSGAETIFGYSSKEMINQPLTLIVPKRFREAHQAGIRRVVSTRKSSLAGQTLELVGLRKGGSEFPLELSLATWMVGEEIFITGIARDVTERKKAEQEILRRNKELADLNRITTSITSMLDLEAILQATAREIVQILTIRNCGIALLNTDQTALTVIADYSESSDEPSATGMVIPLANNPASIQVIETGKALVISDPQSSPLTKSIHTVLKDRNTQGLVIVPLRVRGEVIGTFGLDTTDPNREFTPDEVRLVETIAAQVAGVIKNARLFEQTQATLVERQQAEEELLKALERTESLYRIGDTVATATDQQLIFETVLGEYLRLANLKWGILALQDKSNEYTQVQAMYIDGQPIQTDISVPANNPFFQHLVKNPKPIIIGDVYTHKLTKDNKIIRQKLLVKSMLYIPVVLRGQVMGLITIGSPQKDYPFSQRDIETGQAITDQLAIWLENRNLLTEAQYRSDRLQTAAEVSRAASSILDVGELINTSVNYIRDQFNFYYVGLFLIDEARKWAVLRAGTGQAGRIQLEKNHRLEIGGESMIGWSVANRKARIALDVGGEAVHFKNPILPDTHSEMALPLISRDEVIGALTVQSVERGAFSDEDIALLQTMADQLANVIVNARLFENAAQAQREAEASLHETLALQKLSQNLAGTLNVDDILSNFFEACTQEIGFEYVQFSLVDKFQNRVKAIAGVGISSDHINRANHALDSNDIMVDIIKTGKTEIITGWDDRFDTEIFETEDYTNWVRLFTPVTLRNENIGLVEAGFNKNTQAKIQDSQARLLKAFINQTALGLDNAQRYETSQRAARREALIKEITTKVRASTDLDTILKTTVKEVGDAIGSKRAYIHLVPTQKSNGNTKNGVEAEGEGGH